MRLVFSAPAVLIAFVAFAGVSRAAGRIHIAGSSTVLSCARIVAEQL